MKVDMIIDDKSFMSTLNNIDRNLNPMSDAMIKGLATRYKNRLIKVIRAEHYGSGYLARSVKVKKLSDKNYAVTAAGYIVDLEHGSGPHNMPFPISKKVRMWSSRKGIDAMKFYWYVAKKGTKPHPFTLRTLEQTTYELKKEIERRTDNFLRTKGKSIGGP